MLHISRMRRMATSLLSSLSYFSIEPETCFVTVGAIAFAVRKGESLNNINRPAP